MNSHGHGKREDHDRAAGRSRAGLAEFERLLAAAFRKAGWRIARREPAGEMTPDLVAKTGDRRLLVRLKISSEGRRDRLIPLLAQAVLEAQAIARQSAGPTVPVAVVAAPRIPPSVARRLRDFAERYTPGVSAGVIDAEGLRLFHGNGLEVLNASPTRPAVPPAALAVRPPRLFTDLNQWMLKILLGQALPESLLSVPKGPFRNASRLAEAARVSVMSASRFANQLANEGFLAEHEEWLRIVRVEELLSRWIAISRQTATDIPARWIIKRDRQHLWAALAEYVSGRGGVLEKGLKRRNGRTTGNPPRCSMGLFSAADALGFGFVHGAPPHVCLERLDPDVLRQLGLSVDLAGGQADVFVRIPANREAVFRAAVVRDGLPVSDILQVWLDVSSHPARGREQADLIRREALRPLFSERRDERHR